MVRELHMVKSAGLFRLPWYAYRVRHTPRGPISQIQIRDANHNILFVSARYGEHSGAPLGDKAMEEAAKKLLDAVNERKNDYEDDND
jgi:LDH2 family malate/lactate/ureidoglycolate dehydrogenase